MSHGSSVAAVAVAGNIVVSAGWDGKMSLWDLKTCQRIAKQFEGHEGRITSLFVRGDLLISAGWDRTIRRWDLNSFQSVGAPLRGHTAALYGVAVSRETIVSGSYDKTLRLWNVQTGDPVSDPLPADARALAVAGDIIIAAGAGLYRVDSVTRRSEFSSNPHPAEITSIAVGTNLIVTGSEDNGVGAWDSQTLNGLWSYGDNAMSLPEALRTDGFYSGRLDWMLSVWDPKAPRRIVEITGDAIHRRHSGDAKSARLYDRVSGHTIATVRLGFVVNNAMFRESSLYLGCRHGLLRIDFPSEI
jgi:WD40 repeat protein